MKNHTKQLEPFLRQLGLDFTSSHIDSKGNLQLRCPFARVNGHRSTVDRRPSFGVLLSESGFFANCFACGRKYRSIISFVQDLQKEKLVSDSANAYELFNAFHMQFPDYDEEMENFATELTPIVLPQDIVPAWESKKAIKYHHEHRGIEEDVLQDADVRFDREKEKVIFPCYNRARLLFGWVEHYIDGNHRPKYVNNVDTGAILYLEWLSKGTSIVVVEGMYDALKVYQHLKRLDLLEKYSVVGMFGSFVASTQVHRLIDYYDIYYLMGDNDDAGIKMEKSLFYAIYSKNPAVWKLPYMGKDPAKVTLKQFQRALSKPLHVEVVA